MPGHKQPFMSGLPGPANEFTPLAGGLESTLNTLGTHVKKKCEKKKARERRANDVSRDLRGNYYRSPEAIAAYGERAKEQFPDN
jgi:hypothetical protein